MRKELLKLFSRRCNGRCGLFAIGRRDLRISLYAFGLWDTLQRKVCAVKCINLHGLTEGVTEASRNILAVMCRSAAVNTFKPLEVFVTNNNGQ